MHTLSSPDSATVAEVAALLERLFGVTPAGLEQMSFGETSVTFGASVGERPLIVRTHRDPKTFSGTQGTLDALRGLGIPVPQVYAVDLSCREVRYAYMITERFPGRDLRFEMPSMNRAQTSALAELIMDFEGRASTLGSSGRYGYAPVGAVPPHTTWLDAIASDARISSHLPLELQPLLSAIERATERHADYLRDVQSSCGSASNDGLMPAIPTDRDPPGPSALGPSQIGKYVYDLAVGAIAEWSDSVKLLCPRP